MLPVVLALGGHDPGGGAGIQADIKSISECGARPVTLITALTAQNSSGLAGVAPQQAEQLRLQAKMLLAETEIKAVKAGVIADASLIPVIIEIITIARQKHTVPVVLDPVLACSAGGSFASQDLQQQMLETLLPHCTVITPNRQELLLLGKDDDVHKAVQNLLAQGASAVLASDTEADSSTISNKLYNNAGVIAEYNHPRLPHSFHGSGCTLASALAARMAGGADMHHAFIDACRYTEATVVASIGDNTSG